MILKCKTNPHQQGNAKRFIFSILKSKYFIIFFAVLNLKQQCFVITLHSDLQEKKKTINKLSFRKDSQKVQTLQ